MNPFYRHIVIPLRDFLYPSVCFTCNQPLSPDEDRVCSSCWDSLTLIQPSNWRWQEKHLDFYAEGLVADFLSCYLFEKEGKLQQVVHLLKYEGMKSLGERLGREVGERILTEPQFTQADYLVPVPLHQLKRRERGYNQSEYICRGVAAVTHIPVLTSLIRRTKYTQSQTQLNLIERIENVHDAFDINNHLHPLVRGKTFVLVDDVITTGSTINACARVLLDHGAAQVFAASVALAQ